VHFRLSVCLRLNSFKIAERSVIEFMFDIGEGFGNLTTFVGTTRMSGTPKDRTEAQSVDLAVAWVLYNIKYNSTSIIGILNLQSPHSISNHPTQSPVTPLNLQSSHSITSHPTQSSVTPPNLQSPHPISSHPTQSPITPLNLQSPNLSTGVSAS